jgi:hypothetical protein
MKNDCLDAALRLLEEYGIRDFVIARGSRHPQIRFAVNGGTYVYSFPGSASDYRAVANTRHGLRRLLREIGIITEKPDCRPADRKPDRVAVLKRRIGELEREVADLRAQLRGVS